MIRIVFIAATVLVLVACGAKGSHDAGSTNTPVKTADAMTPPRPANDLPARSVLDAMPDFNGIGPLRFGMTAEQMRKAWGAPLHGETPANDPQACYYLRPRKDNYDLLFMVEGDRFVRVDVKTTLKTAPGGGQVGMEAQQIGKLYPGRVHLNPGKYGSNTKILSVSSRVKGVGLIFETDSSGVVKAWRIGVSPQVDYVEGCG